MTVLFEITDEKLKDLYIEFVDYLKWKKYHTVDNFNYQYFKQIFEIKEKFSLPSIDPLKFDIISAYYKSANPNLTDEEIIAFIFKSGLEKEFKQFEAFKNLERLNH